MCISMVQHPPIHTMLQKYGNTFNHKAFCARLHTRPGGAMCRQAPPKVHTWLWRDMQKHQCVWACACLKLGEPVCQQGLGHQLA